MVSHRSSLALASIFAICSASLAQTWTAQIITPPGYTHAGIWAGPASSAGPYLGGHLGTFGSEQAAVFDLTGIVYTMSVPGASRHLIAGGDGNNFTGWAYFGSARHSIAWRASGAGQWTATDLHVAGALSSTGWDTEVGQVVGNVTPTSGNERAALWTKTQKYVDLHPQGYTISRAYSLSGKTQVGYADFRAASWRGTARTFRDLHPAGYGGSLIYRADGGIGYGLSQAPDHAMVWDLRTGQATDLHPAGASYSAAYEGNASLGLVGGWVDNQATIWDSSGIPTNLHQFLPPEYALGISEVYAIWMDGPLLRVGGVIWEDFSGLRTQAVVWTFQ